MVSSVYFLNSLDLFFGGFVFNRWGDNWFYSSFFSAVDESVFASRHDDDEVQVVRLNPVLLCEEVQRLMR